MVARATVYSDNIKLATSDCLEMTDCVCLVLEYTEERKRENEKERERERREKVHASITGDKTEITKL